MDRGTSKKGFTLMELMTVVFIITILSSVAIPAYSKYMKRAKVGEVYLNLRKIYDGEVSYYNEEHVTSGGVTLTKQFVVTRIEPAWPPTKDKNKGNFDTGDWPAIHFSSDSALLYCYYADAYPFPSPYPYYRPPEFDITADPPHTPMHVAFQAAANGDLDGDGKFSHFYRSMWWEVGKPDFQADAAVFTEDELE